MAAYFKVVKAAAEMSKNEVLAAIKNKTGISAVLISSATSMPLHDAFVKLR
jgi:hypothetical protein